MVNAVLQIFCYVYSIRISGNLGKKLLSGIGLNFTTDLLIFNTSTLTWSLSNATNAPLPMYGYCVVTLPDGNILYIGGYSLHREDSIPKIIPMNILQLYNTTNDTWTNMSIPSHLPSPPPRSDFSAVLASGGRIIIFGGDFSGQFHGDLWIFNTDEFEWSTGNISNPIVDLKLSGHTATLVDNYMFVSFGRFQNDSLSSKIFMLDVSRKDSYKWVTEFTPNATTIPNTLTNFLVGATVGSISIVCFIIFVSVIFYFLMKRLNLVILFS
ncbi:hypothetical protein C2G38_2137018 [Gigaspora rosea]|uniref:Galactose oxidase n=1 Tax=Gigaspora rosea TaxID=44941 RepID=A0A397W509_9GLOM|nr:hypothetical protein C2G38_2137018 [Gigaspora rosea]